MTNKDNKGTIFLIPTFLAEDNGPDMMAPAITEIIRKVSYYLVEEVRTARRFISRMKTGRVIDDLRFFVLNKDTTTEQVREIFSQIPQGEDIGIISEAGCPGIADPGAVAVMIGHTAEMKIVPLPGPSSILMALMGSGFQGQNFAFNGYLSLEKSERNRQIKVLEKEVLSSGRTEIFMETPYRNNGLFEELLKELKGDTLLCIASNISAQDEMIRTMTVENWKKNKPDLHKKPTVFLIGTDRKNIA
jgi:16S rRNA (cytidine1402-2'-O)-methyltransferase